MPAIAGPSSSPQKHVVGSRSESIGGVRSAEVNTSRKRKLISDSAAEVSATVVLPVNSISTPMKWKSPRRCAVSIPKTSDEVSSLFLV
jgi:cell division control protein 6